MENEMPGEAKKTLAYKGAVYGTVAGSIATWSISSAIAAAELILGLQISTFYSIMGISLGFNNVITAAYLGFGLHLLTGTALGAALGAIGIRWEKIHTLDLFKNTLIGIGAGIVIWLILFLPITTLLIQPSIQRIVILLALGSNHSILSENINHSITNIVLAAIAFHLVWGAIFSFIMRSLVRIRVFKMKQQQNLR